MPILRAMVLAADLTSQMSFDDLAAVVEENGEPFESLAQCDVFLRAAAMLFRRAPEEIEEGGQKMRTRDIERLMLVARKARARFQYCIQKPVHIIPPAALR